MTTQKQAWQRTFQQIADSGLWVGDIDALYQNPTDHFDLVVSVCQDTAGENVGCDYVHYPLADDEHSVRNWGGTTDYRVFSAAVDTVSAAVESDEYENVLVHCHSGQNRSVAVCAAVIATRFGNGYEFGKMVVEDARPIANPNETMESHARRYIAES